MIYSMILCFAVFSAAKAEYGAFCNTTDQCPGQTECNNGKCVCEIGTHYNSSSEQCQNDCESYGSNFQYINNIIWNAPNSALISYASAANICECTDQCKNNSQCVYAVYAANIPECYLFNRTSDNATDWVALASFQGLVRSCAADACPPGQYITSSCVETDIMVGPGCSDCPAGTVPNADQSACSNCPAGTVPNVDQSACTDCVNNTISAAGDPECTSCDSDELAINNHTECQTLENLTFSAVDQSGRTEGNKPQYAVDDNIETCALTGEKNNPFWNGTLTSTSVVTQVKILDIGPGNQPTGVNVTVYVEGQVCDNFVGSAQHPAVYTTFNCPYGTQGDRILVQRHTKPGKKRKLRICDLVVTGYTGIYTHLIGNEQNNFTEKIQVGNDQEMAQS